MCLICLGQGGRLNLDAQIDNYANSRHDLIARHGEVEAVSLLRGALFSVTMGSNDFINNYLTPIFSVPQRVTTPPVAFISAMIAKYRQQLTVSFSRLQLGNRRQASRNGNALLPVVCRAFAEAVPPGRPQDRGGERGADRLHPVPEGDEPVGRHGLRRVPEPAGAGLQSPAQGPGGQAPPSPARASSTPTSIASSPTSSPTTDPTVPGYSI